MPEVLGLRELGGRSSEREPEPGPEPGRVDAATPADAAGGSEAGGGSELSRWRRWAAAGVVGGLVVGVVAVLGGGSANDERSVEPARTAGTSAGSPVERAAVAALDAWARFASTGAVDQLRASFDSKGPQFERLNAEAAGVRARAAGESGAYAFFAEAVRVSGGSQQRDEQVVSADVVMSRHGENDQRFSWELVLRRHDGRWMLWTVRERAGVSAAATTGGAP